MAEPLILWDETDRFLELLGRSQDVHALLFPPKNDKKSNARPLLLDEAGRQTAEAVLAMPRYRRFSLGVRINPGGTKADEITEGVALFLEADGGLPIEEQEAIPARLGLPPCTFTTWSGSRSLHLYWCAEEGGELSPDEWRKAQERLIAAVEKEIPEAGVDKAIKDACRVMRAPGGIHPATGERCRIHSEGGERFNLTHLVEMLPELPAKKKPKVSAPTAATGDDIQKAREALSFLPPMEHVSYDKWNPTGMALHWVSRELLPDWIEWSRGMGDAFNEEECIAKWVTFDEERDESITLGSLIHWAKAYGYKPPQAVKKAEPVLLPWSQLIALTLEAVRAGDIDAEMELRAEISSRYRRSDSQVDAALFRLLTEQEAGSRQCQDIPDSVDLSSVEGLDYLVDGFVPANGLALSYGPKGVGKTTAAVALSFSLIDGKGFLDHAKPAPKGRVLFIASDSGAGPLRNVLQDAGLGDHPALRPGEDQQFFVWAHEASQGHTAWDVGVRGCVRLLQFVREKEIDLVVIDSAKAVCAKAGISYADNDSVNALLTFMKEALTPHTAILFLSHDGTAAGSHAGAKAWAEIVDVVHRQTMNEGEPTRTWTVVKNRLGPTRQFSYSLDDGELVLSAGVETISDASEAVMAILREAHAKGQERLSRRGLFDEALRRFNYAPKTLENTIARLVQGKAPRVVRKGKGFYALSPKELYRGCLGNGGGWDQIPSAAIDLPTPQVTPNPLGSGVDVQSEDRSLTPMEPPKGEARGVGTSIAPQSISPQPPPKESHPPLEAFDSVELFDGKRWGNGWMVTGVEGDFVDLLGVDNKPFRARAGLVRLCEAA